MVDEVTLPREVWEERRQTHHEAFDALVQPHLVRRSHHIKDTVADFLFEYYAFRPSYLRKWTPGFGYVLEGATLDEFPEREGFRRTAEGIRLDTTECSPHFCDRTRWIRDMLRSTQTRTPQFGCFGLHEWAMLYRSDDPRHATLDLRISAEKIAEVIEGSKMNCTHFDAFRFFTPKAKPFNSKYLTRDDMRSSEQRGCLHANMDVYRWAFKRYPWVASELIFKAFKLALEIRRLDMAASPYDLLAEGVNPVPVETPEGRQTYLELQKDFSNQAFELRSDLIASYDKLLAVLYPDTESFAKALLSS